MLDPRSRPTGPGAWPTWRKQADVHEPTVGAAHSRSPRVESIAARLTALTGSTPRVSTHGLCTRIEADLARQLSEAAQHMLYLVLADADQCGREMGDNGGYVWAELQVPLPGPGTLTAEQRAGYECALCGMRLYTSRLLGTAGGVQLWGCSPAC